LQRVIAFLLKRRILIAPNAEGTEVGERVDLYIKSKEVIGAFWTE